MGAASLGAVGGGYRLLGSAAGLSASEISSRKPLAMPPLIDTTKTGAFTVKAQSGTTSFVGGRPTPTIGFNQPYLGPVVRVAKGGIQPTVQNKLSWPVSTHWHGLVVPGEHDGGPHIAVRPGREWSPDMEIAQVPCTAFFHTHVHGRTASDVYSGLAGALHVVDGRDSERGLPETYGLDDLTLLLQDRRFSQDGALVYANSMMDMMHGMTGDRMVINGQLEPVAVVPKSIVRLRLINGSNARIFSLFFSDGRPMHLIATDGGYLPETVSIDRLRLSPGERAEVLVDFSDAQNVTLVSDGDPNEGMGGMMGHARSVLDRATGLREFAVLPFTVDERLERPISGISEKPGGSVPRIAETDVTQTRRFTLNMGMGGRMMRGGGGVFAINNQPFDMNIMNERIKLGATEKWIVRNDMLAHPFHIHGVQFQVLSENGNSPRLESQGWKDTVVVDSEVELLVKFTQPASVDAPFMYHCHILEHEDGGMMGQFTVV